MASVWMDFTVDPNLMGEVVELFEHLVYLLARSFILTYEGYPRVYSEDYGVSDDSIESLLWVRNDLASGTA